MLIVFKFTPQYETLLRCRFIAYEYNNLIPPPPSQTSLKLRTVTISVGNLK